MTPTCVVGGYAWTCTNRVDHHPDPELHGEPGARSGVVHRASNASCRSALISLPIDLAAIAMLIDAQASAPSLDPHGSAPLALGQAIDRAERSEPAQPSACGGAGDATRESSLSPR